MKPFLLVLLAVLLAPLARADTITTTGTVSVQVGCWNPNICGGWRIVTGEPILPVIALRK